MAVIASFIVDPVDSEKGLIPPSQAVQFQDTSSGNPDAWIWDFGDGEMSYEQNPLHTYTGETLDTFSVSLTAYIEDTPILQGNVSSINSTRQSNILFGNLVTFADYSSQSWSLNSVNYASFMNKQFNVEPPESKYIYLGSRIEQTKAITTPDALTVAYIAEAKRTMNDPNLPRTLIEQSSRLFLKINSQVRATINGTGNIGTWFPVADISDMGGMPVFDYDLTPESESSIDPVAVGGQSGIIAQSQVFKRMTTAEENVDTLIIPDFVVFGAKPIAAFTAAPTKGNSPLMVAFNNTSTEAIGLPTTWSWKKRKTGSEDSFVEFSTAKHPTEIFTKP